MEKRVFSLYARKGIPLAMADRVLYLTLLGVMAAVGWRGSGTIAHILIVTLLALALANTVRFAVSVKHRTLEVSDEGLTLLTWPRSCTRIGWDAVRSCDIWLGSQYDREPFQQVIVHYSRWKAIWISGACPDAAEILDILKQRLPESVFVTR